MNQCYAEAQSLKITDQIFSNLYKARFKGSLIIKSSGQSEGQMFDMEIQRQDNENESNLFKINYSMGTGVCESLYSMDFKGAGVSDDKSSASFYKEEESENSNCIEEIVIRYNQESVQFMIILDEEYTLVTDYDSSAKEGLNFPHIFNEDDKNHILVSLDLGKKVGSVRDLFAIKQNCAYEISLDSEDDALIRPLNRFAYNTGVSSFSRHVKYYIGGTIIVTGTVIGTTIMGGSAAATWIVPPAFFGIVPGVFITAGSMAVGGGLVLSATNDITENNRKEFIFFSLNNGLSTSKNWYEDYKEILKKSGNLPRFCPTLKKSELIERL